VSNCFIDSSFKHDTLFVTVSTIAMSTSHSRTSPAINLPALELIEQRIFLIRGQKVMLDSDLAALYGVTTFNFNKAVKRNSARFPEDFMFQISKEEFDLLRFQIGMSNPGRGGRRYLPYVFTEHGVAMLSSVLRSERAVQVNIAIMRAFIRLRSILAAHKELARKIESLEKETKATFKVVFDLINKYLKPPADQKNKIGFRTGAKK
jgi:hypothetical protein